jgi:hypothetical protein
VGPRAGLDAVVRRKIPNPCREPNPGRPLSVIANICECLLVTFFSLSDTSQNNVSADRVPLSCLLVITHSLCTYCKLIGIYAFYCLSLSYSFATQHNLCN